MLAVAAVLALGWHAIEPGMPLGAWMTIFCAVNLCAWPGKLLGRGLRGMSVAVFHRLRAGRAPGVPKGSGFGRRSRVHPPL
jgi:hypothetical protein